MSVQTKNERTMMEPEKHFFKMCMFISAHLALVILSAVSLNPFGDKNNVSKDSGMKGKVQARLLQEGCTLDAILDEFAGLNAKIEALDTNIKKKHERLEATITSIKTDISSFHNSFKTDVASLITSVNDIHSDAESVDYDILLSVKADTTELIYSVGKLGRDIAYLKDPALQSVQVSISNNHVCALLSDTVQCAGHDYWGQLGLGLIHSGSSTFRNSPVTLLFLQNFVQVKFVTGDEHTCILTKSKTVYCVGNNDHRQLGVHSSLERSNTPVQVMKDGSGFLQEVNDIVAGPTHNCAILSSGLMYCWGSDNRWNYEQNINVAMMALSQDATCIVLKSDLTKVKCKEGTFQDKVYYMEQDITKLTAGHHHFCALLSDGTAKCFGRNFWGQLGNGSRIFHDTPLYVLTISTPLPLEGITDINAGGDSTCLVADGTPMCFGRNNYFQLDIANNIGDHILYPTELTITLPSGKEVVSVHVGEYTGHAVFSDNSVYSWGTNRFGALGDGSETSADNVIGNTLGEAAVKMAFSFS